MGGDRRILLTITFTALEGAARPTTDPGLLLHKNLGRVQAFEQTVLPRFVQRRFTIGY